MTAGAYRLEMMKKKLPIGIEDFEEILTEGFYYVDKTGMIRDLLHNWNLLHNWGKVNLFYPPQAIRKISEYEHAEELL